METTGQRLQQRSGHDLPWTGQPHPEGEPTFSFSSMPDWASAASSMCGSSFSKISMASTR
jgi:hypothetical protein